LPNLPQFMHDRRKPHQDETARDGDAASHQQCRAEPGFADRDSQSEPEHASRHGDEAK